MARVNDKSVPIREIIKDAVSGGPTHMDCAAEMCEKAGYCDMEIIEAVADMACEGIIRFDVDGEIISEAQLVEVTL